MVSHVQRKLGVSERRVCRALGQSRSSQRYNPSENDEEKRLVSEMLSLVGRHPRFGYRRIWAVLRPSKKRSASLAPRRLQSAAKTAKEAAFRT